MSTILHIDLDAFFASVEIRDNPSLVGKPVVVGHRGGRSVVTAASYEARKFGCRSAMPMFEALRRCPQAVVVEPRRAAYTEASGKFFAILSRYTPLVEPLSIDEAFLDMTGTERLFGEPVAIAHEIRAAIRDEISLPASVGIAPVKFVAKLATDSAKPDGVLHITQDKLLDYLCPLPVERLFGVGPKMSVQLRNLGLTTLGQLAAYDRAALHRRFGHEGERLHDLARGIDVRTVEADRETRSISAEETFSVDLHRGPALDRHLLALVEKTASRMRHENLRGNTVVLKVKNPDFQISTRRQKLPQATQDTMLILETAIQLLKKAPIDARGIRLLGVGMTDLAAEDLPAQLDFASPSHNRREKLGHTLDKIRDRFGKAAVSRAALLDNPSDEE